VSVDVEADAIPIGIESRRGLNVADVCAIVGVVVLSAAYLPGWTAAWDAPRVAVFLLAVPVGVVGVPLMAWRRDPTAAVLTAFLGCGLVASLLAESRTISLVGGIGRQSSWVLWCGAAGLWAIGRSTTELGRSRLVIAAVASGAVSLAFAVVQLIVQPDRFDMSLEQGRPVGLVGNPIYFGAIMCGLAAVVAHPARATGSRLGLAGFGVFAFGAAVSGSRIAVVVTLLIAAAVAASGARRRGLVLGATIAGANVLAIGLHRAIGTGQSAGERIGTSGVQDRLDLWSFGLKGWADRPLLGAGVGRFRAATQSHYSDAWAGRFSDDRSGAWLDAHNLFVEMLVTVGIIGLALLIVLFVQFARRGQGALAWGAAAIATTWLLEPAALAPLGIAALFIGAAMAQPDGPARPNRATWLSALLIIGLALGSWYLVGMRALDGWLPPPVTDTSPPAWPLWRFDPLAASSASESVDLQGSQDPSVASFAIRWAERAVDLEPDFPYWRSNLAFDLLVVGETSEARRVASEALDDQPNHVRTLEILQVVALRDQDHALFDGVTEQLCELERPTCEMSSPGP
jgi:hypothetical protein